LQRNKTSLHIVTSVGYSIEYYDARNNKYQVQFFHFHDIITDFNVSHVSRYLNSFDREVRSIFSRLYAYIHRRYTNTMQNLCCPGFERLSVRSMLFKMNVTYNLT